MRSVRARLLAGGLLVAVSVAFAPAALASNDLGVRMPDGTPAYLYRNNLPTGFNNAAEWVRQNDWNPTDLTTLCAASVGSTYVNIVVGGYGETTWFGLYDCATGPNYGICNRADVIVNNDLKPPDGDWSTQDRRSILCEEMGHALGLAHRYPSPKVGCMSQQWDEVSYTAHDISHINSWY